MINESFKIFFISYFVIYGSIHFLLILVSYFEMKFGILYRLMTHFDAQTINSQLRGVSLLVSESKNRSLPLKLQYPQYEVINIDARNPNSINEALKKVHFPYVCLIHAETPPEDFLFQIMKLILLKKRTVYAVSSPLISGYWNAQLSKKIALARFNCLLESEGIIVIEKETAMKMGGIEAFNFFNLHRYLLENKISGDVIFYPYVLPHKILKEVRKDYVKCKMMEFRNLGRHLWRHRVMFLNPHYKQIGLVAFPYYVFIEFLGPLFILLGLVLLPFFFFL